MVAIHKPAHDIILKPVVSEKSYACLLYTSTDLPNLQEVRMADKNSAETATKAAKLAVNVEDKKAAAQAEVDALVRKAQKRCV